MKTIKVFHSTRHSKDFDWYYNKDIIIKPSPSFEDADLIVFTGGADVDPMFYSEKKGRRTGSGGQRDVVELTMLSEAIKKNKLIFGICRGHQLMCVGLGGKLIQDVNHPGFHKVKTYDGHKFFTNSYHHQMIYPYSQEMHQPFQVLSWARNISPYHLNGENKEIEFEETQFSEIESIVYPKIKALSIQSHPEWEQNIIANAWLTEQVNKFLFNDILESVAKENEYSDECHSSC